VPARLWAHDASLWTDDPKGQQEIRNRLGWLHAPADFARTLPAELAAFAEEVHAAGIDRALLLGMGGSSLGPEVISLVFGRADRFAILDSTDPAQVLATARCFPIERTLFIVSSKSGGTAEVNALLAFFWDRARRRLGQRAGEHFMAITDPGTSLEREARQRGFRRILLGEPSIGGRFSVLSPFGLAPAALMGVDTAHLLERATWMAAQCSAEQPAARNPGLVLGALLAEAALHGRDKLTLLADAPWESFGAWLEQLIAESSGKNGVGIVPIDGEPPASIASYADDRLFVYLRRTGQHDHLIRRLRQGGFPAIVWQLSQEDDLGAEFYRWSMATAVACAILGVNAFDQPDVQDNKTRTLAKIEAFKQSGALEAGQFITLDSDTPGQVAQFLAQKRRGDYLAINAYLPRNRRTAAILRALRSLLRAKTGLATTVGFGPRFLHSTGQLHKGGADNGLFLQITAEAARDVPIPTQGITFGLLQRAQALGDYEALQARQRRVLRLHLPNVEALRELLTRLERDLP